MKQKTSWFLIDDDYDDQIIFEIALKEMNADCHCNTAHNGKRALQMINENPDFNPDFIFMDLNMPIMDGRECLIEIRKIGRFKYTPIYIYSAPADRQTVKAVISMGATGFIFKQSTIPAIIYQLEKVIAMSEKVS